jgi:hypothetical protein
MFLEVSDETCNVEHLGALSFEFVCDMQSLARTQQDRIDEFGFFELQVRTE